MAVFKFQLGYKAHAFIYNCQFGAQIFHIFRSFTQRKIFPPNFKLKNVLTFGVLLSAIDPKQLNKGSSVFILGEVSAFALILFLHIGEGEVSLSVDFEVDGVEAYEEEKTSAVVLGVSEEHFDVCSVGLEFDPVALPFGSHHVIEKRHRAVAFLLDPLVQRQNVLLNFCQTPAKLQLLVHQAAHLELEVNLRCAFLIHGNSELQFILDMLDEFLAFGFLLLVYFLVVVARQLFYFCSPHRQLLRFLLPVVHHYQVVLTAKHLVGILKVRYKGCTLLLTHVQKSQKLHPYENGSLEHLVQPFLYHL